MTNPATSAPAPLSFSFDQSFNVRVVMVDGDPWFVAKDIAVALGYSRPNDVLAKLDADERRHIQDPNSIHDVHTLNAISETGLFKIISRCRKKSAKKLQKLILSNVTLSKERVLGMFCDLDIEDFDQYFVYAVQEQETGRIKIGISKDPERRVKDLQTANSQKLRLLAFVPAPHGYRDERIAHEKAGNHVRGEWFDCGTDKAIATICGR